MVRYMSEETPATPEPPYTGEVTVVQADGEEKPGWANAIVPGAGHWTGGLRTEADLTEPIKIRFANGAVVPMWPTCE
jgi:hypothetical protein